MITNKGLMKLVRALSPDETLTVYQLWVTNDPTAPAVTDTTTEFCDGSSYEVAQLTITQSYPSGSTMTFTASAGFTEANFDWEKIGLVDEDGILIASKVYTTTKDATMQIEVVYELEVA